MGVYGSRWGSMGFSPCPGRPSWQRIRIQWSEMLRITRGCRATATLPGTPPPSPAALREGAGSGEGLSQWGSRDGGGGGARKCGQGGVIGGHGEKGRG